MLNKNILRAAAAAMTMTCMAGPASADSFRILMMDYAFFPEISYVKPGDTVTFVNMSGSARDIQAEGGDWEIFDLADGGEVTIDVIAGMPNVYKTVIDPEGDAADEDNTVIGKLNFSDAPTLELD